MAYKIISLAPAQRAATECLPGWGGFDFISEKSIFTVN